jgi:hypothetical protein
VASITAFLSLIADPQLDLGTCGFFSLDNLCLADDVGSYHIDEVSAELPEA